MYPCVSVDWRGQATGAVLARGSLRTFSKGQMLSADAVIIHSRPREQFRQSPTLTASGPFRSSPEIQPAINTHRSRSGQRFVQSIFSSPPRRPPLECFPSVSRRGADLKILCSIPLTEYRLDLPSTLNIVPLAVAAFGKV